MHLCNVASPNKLLDGGLQEISRSWQARVRKLRNKSAGGQGGKRSFFFPVQTAWLPSILTLKMVWSFLALHCLFVSPAINSNYQLTGKTWFAPNLNSSYTQTSLPHHVPTQLLQAELLLDSDCVPVYLNTWSRTYHLKCTNVKIR